MIVTDLSKSFNPVPKNLQRIKQSSAENKQKKGQIKKKSSRLAKLERQRDKNLVKEGKGGHSNINVNIGKAGRGYEGL